MGKLNYTNRKISGTKLGDLVKRDTFKHSQQAAKARSAKDPHLEIVLQGKALGDEGLQIACVGFIAALSTGNLKIDELNLSENGITVRGLKFLSQVIHECTSDLKDLDLKGNKLMVENEDEETIWEEFLQSFRNVSSLRRIDFSGNPISDRGFEILWRVYSREQPVYIPAMLRNIFSDISEDMYVEEGPDSETLQKYTRNLAIPNLESRLPSPPPSTETTPTKKNGEASPKSSPSRAGEDKQVELHGLRSVPYMVFRDTVKTDCSALFLSYILQIHPIPEYLMPYMPTPKGCQALLFEDYQTTGCDGIIYKPNPLGETSTQLLKCAEFARNPKSWLQMDVSSPSTPSKHKRGSDTNLLSRGRKGAFGSNTDAELIHIRSKIQGNVLKDNGANHVQLWSCALRMLILCRVIFFNMPEITEKASGSDLGDQPSSSKSIEQNSPDELINFFSEMDLLSPPHSPTPESKGRSASQSETTQSEEELASDESDDRILPKSLTDLVTMEVSILPGQLPEHVWTKILLEAADPIGHINSDQSRKIVEYARSKETLEREREAAGKHVGVQIWKVLDGMDCLAYECL